MKKQTCDFSMLYANAWLNSWNITFWQLKKTTRLKKLFDIHRTIKFIFEKHCIRKAMSQKKHQLCFVVPKEKGCSVHLIVKKKTWLNAKIRVSGASPPEPGPTGLCPGPNKGLTAASDPWVFWCILHFQPGYAPALFPLQRFYMDLTVTLNDPLDSLPPSFCLHCNYLKSCYAPVVFEPDFFCKCINVNASI